MPNYLEGLGQQAGSAAINGLMGVFLGGYNDERQIRQQQELQNMQIRGQKEMTDYEWQKQMQMWEATNYPAQLAMMKKAGLSPGLMYGKGGGGATTVGSASGHVQGGTAATGGGQEIQQMIGMGMQREMQQAQIENLQANTDKTKAETGNVPLTGANIQASTGLTNTQTELAKIEQQIKGATIEEAIQIAVGNMAKLQQEVLQQEVKTNVDRATQNTKIDTIKAQLIATLLGNELTRAQTTTEKGKPSVQAQEIESMKKHIENTVLARMQKWREIEIQGQQANTHEREKINQLTSELNKELNAPFEVIEKVVQAIILRNVIQNTPGQPFWKKGTQLK